MSELRVLAFGAWDSGAGYPRADALLLGLRSSGCLVDECRFELPFAGTEKRRLLTSPWLWPGYWWSLRKAKQQAIRALTAAVEAHRPDVVLVPYPGHLVVRWVREAFGGPIVLDLFLSAYDTVVIDRQMCKPGSPLARFMRRTDQRACEAADCVLVDTPANAVFTSELVGLPRERFVAVPVSDPMEAGEGLPYRPPEVDGTIELLFFGTGVPLHGLGHLLDAVEQCDRVHLTLVCGSAADRVRAQAIPSSRVRVLGEFVDPEVLRDYLARSHLVAGVFGTSQKADRVIPFKVMQALSVGRPVITARTRATSSVLREGIDAVLVPPGNATALAAVLSSLAEQPERLAELAAGARTVYERRFSLDVTGGALRDACRACVDRFSSRAETAELVEMT